MLTKCSCCGKTGSTNSFQIVSINEKKFFVCDDCYGRVVSDPRLLNTLYKGQNDEPRFTNGAEEHSVSSGNSFTYTSNNAKMKTAIGTICGIVGTLSIIAGLIIGLLLYSYSGMVLYFVIPFVSGIISSLLFLGVEAIIKNQKIINDKLDKLLRK